MKDQTQAKLTTAFGTRMPMKILVGLIAGNLLWSAHPVMGKLVLADFTPAEGAWLRHAGALVTFILLVVVSRIRGRKAEFAFTPASRQEWLLGLALGFLAFCYAPLLQMNGLQVSRASDNALIIAMEPLITVILGWFVLRERVSAVHGLSFVVALAGFGLLASTPGSGGWDPRALGNVAILISLLGEASYSVIGRKLIGRNSPIGVFGFALISGVCFLTIATALIGHIPFDFISRLTWKSALALLWLGPFGTTLSYLFWMIALRRAPLAGVALTLFIQPVCGALWGWLFLGERLSALQFAGGLTIVLAVFAQTLIQLLPGERARSVATDPVA